MIYLSVYACINSITHVLYYYCHVAKEIIRRVVERLAVSMETFGFDSEDAMVENLTMTQSLSGRAQTCFTRGAGDFICVRE